MSKQGRAPNGEFNPGPERYAVIYARVSSKEQEKEGFSIPSQLKLLRTYAATITRSRTAAS
jgi:hypothetical protein